MNLRPLLSAVLVAFPISAAPANAGKTINEAGALACVNDKWDEKELEKGHKMVDYAGRCVHIPHDPAAQKSADDCVGKYEYMPDESWKASGTCTLNFQDKSSITGTWEEGSHLKEYTWTVTGGTGKYQGARGSSTYSYENLSDTLAGGRYKGTLERPEAE